MATQRKAVAPPVQERLREVAAELRQVLSGEAGYPAWGTRFSEIEADGMAVGLELARLLMQQSTQEQAAHMPDDALAVAGDVVAPAGTQQGQPLQTPAGLLTWDEPCGYLKRARKPFFPSAARVGD